MLLNSPFLSYLIEWYSKAFGEKHFFKKNFFYLVLLNNQIHKKHSIILAKFSPALLFALLACVFLKTRSVSQWRALEPNMLVVLALTFLPVSLKIAKSLSISAKDRVGADSRCSLDWWELFISAPPRLLTPSLIYLSQDKFLKPSPAVTYLLGQCEDSLSPEAHWWPTSFLSFVLTLKHSVPFLFFFILSLPLLTFCCPSFPPGILTSFCVPFRGTKLSPFHSPLSLLYPQSIRMALRTLESCSDVSYSSHKKKHPAPAFEE